MKVALSILFGAIAVFVAFAVRLEIHFTRLVDNVTPEIQSTRSALADQLAAVRLDALAEIDSQALLLQQQLRGSLFLVNGQVSELQHNALLAIGATLAIADQRIGDSLERVDTALGEVKELQGDLRPVFANAAQAEQGATALMATYRALPGELGEQLAPSWEKLQPEITCRQLDGTGYGGCWHARITALMGEAANVGGVFTQRFPQFATSVDGIAMDVHTFTRKAVAPRGFWGTFKDVFATASGGVRAAGAAGLFDHKVAFHQLPPLQTSAQ
jgi:hypothetical protein